MQQASAHFYMHTACVLTRDCQRSNIIQMEAICVAYLVKVLFATFLWLLAKLAGLFVQKYPAISFFIVKNNV